MQNSNQWIKSWGVVLALLLTSWNMYGCSDGEAKKPAPESVINASEKYVDEIKDLADKVPMKEALDFIKSHDKQTVQNQIELTEIQAPSFKENEFGRDKQFARLLKEYGADSVWTDSVGNIIGLRHGTEGAHTLALAGHLDTVFPEGTDVQVQQKGDTLYAPGISDDGRGLTTVLTALRSLKETGLKLKDDLLVIGNVGEEGLGDLRGMKYLFKHSGMEIDYFISIDGTSSEGVTHRALGSHRYRITFHGPGGHSWGAFGLGNPHHALGRSIALFVDKADPYTSKGPKTSYNVGRIGGGTSVNSIPFESWMEVDMRSESAGKLEGIDKILHEAVNQALEEQNKLNREGPPLTVEVTLIGDRPSGSIQPDEPLVQRAIATTSYLGKEPKLRISSTDSNIPISLGIPAITMGGGGKGHGAHSLHEWYLNEGGPEGIQRVLLIVAAQAGVADEAGV